MLAMDETVIEIGALKIRYLIDGVVSGAASGMFELTVPPGARVPRRTATATTRRSSTASKACCAAPSGARFAT